MLPDPLRMVCYECSTVCFGFEAFMAHWYMIHWYGPAEDR